MNRLKRYYFAYFTVLFLGLCFQQVKAQGLGAYTVSGMTGSNPAAAQTTITYRFLTSEGKMYLSYDSKVQIITNQGYQYKGNNYYSGQIPGLEALMANLRAYSPKVTFSVYYKSTYFGQFQRNIDGPLSGMLGDVMEVGPIKDKEASNIANWSVRGESLDSYLQADISKWIAVEELIDKYEFKQKQSKELDALLVQADGLLNRKDYAKAVVIYKNALDYNLRTSYVAQQLKHAEAGLGLQDKKRQFDNFMTIGADAAEKKNFSAAIGIYQSAAKLGYNDVKANFLAEEMKKLMQQAKEDEEKEYSQQAEPYKQGTIYVSSSSSTEKSKTSADLQKEKSREKLEEVKTAIQNKEQASGNSPSTISGNLSNTNYLRIETTAQQEQQAQQFAEALMGLFAVDPERTKARREKAIEKENSREVNLEFSKSLNTIAEKLLRGAQTGNVSDMLALGEYYNIKKFKLDGIFYENGENPEQAFFWFNKAAGYGNTKALEYIYNIATNGNTRAWGSGGPYVKYKLSDQESFNALLKYVGKVDKIEKSNFQYKAYKLLADRYKRGIGCFINPKMARSMEALYSQWTGRPKFIID